MPDMEIKGSVALVTGASRGFGRAIATALSEAGAKVAGVARDRGGAGGTARRTRRRVHRGARRCRVRL